MQHPEGHVLSRLLLPAVAACIAACASPNDRFDRTAQKLGLGRDVLPGVGFLHAVYVQGECSGCATLHVYFGSDGTPWIGNQPAEDPTPRNPLTLRLMKADPKPSIYVGRPCYHGSGGAALCTTSLWTDARYSEAVIASITAAVDAYSAQVGAGSVVLVGYSGGGAIAMLVAGRLDNVVAIVTVAANLDIEAWTDHHGYEPLSASLNPADVPALPADIIQLHLTGELDSAVPPTTIGRFRAAQPHALFTTYDEFNHVCCWEASWPQILDGLP